MRKQKDVIIEHQVGPQLGNHIQLKPQGGLQSTFYRSLFFGNIKNCETKRRANEWRFQ